MIPMHRPAMAALVCAALVLSSGRPSAQIVISANDAKVALADGAVTVVPGPPPDTVTILDLSATPPKVIAEIPVPASVIGPPESVDIAPDGTIALVTAATRIDPKDPTRTIPDDRVTVLDLQTSPPSVIETLRAGEGASGVSFNPAGTLALVANRMEGTISVFTVNGRTVARTGTVSLGAPESGPSHVVFTRDGRRALVTRNNDSFISVLAVEGSTVRLQGTDLAGGLRPYSIVVSPAADIAVVGHVGAGPTGGVDTLAIVDLAADPPRVVHQVAAGPTVEGVALSADGRHVAVTVMNGSNTPSASPFHHANGLLRIFRLEGKALTPVADAPVGRWCQGAAWSRDAGTLLVQCMVERELRVFRFDGKALNPAGAIKVGGGPAGIRTGR
jgi:DNA-binding beta-propeller fold protein YncE